MNAIASLRAPLGALNRSLVAQFGDTVTVYRATAASVTDGTRSASYAAVAALTNVYASFVSPLHAAKRFPFGLSDEITLVCLIPFQVSGMPTVLQTDAIKVTSGPYLGKQFKAVTGGMPDAFGTDAAVPLVEDATLVLP